MKKRLAAPSPKRSDMTVHNTSVQSDWTDPRTTARRDLANAIVSVGHEHVATRIHTYANGSAEADVGTRPVGK